MMLHYWSFLYGLWVTGSREQSNHLFAKDIRADTTTTVSSDNWYQATANWPAIAAYVDSWSGCSDLHALDVFGVSGSISKAWRRRHYRALSWDIKLSPEMDIMTENGFFGLLDLCLRLTFRWIRLRIWLRIIEYDWDRLGANQKLGYRLTMFNYVYRNSI